MTIFLTDSSSNLPKDGYLIDYLYFLLAMNYVVKTKLSFLKCRSVITFQHNKETQVYTNCLYSPYDLDFKFKFRFIFNFEG